LSGRLFNQDWAARTAVARPSLNNADVLVVELYAEEIFNACDQNFVSSSLPYATVHIPKDYSVTEYTADFKNGLSSPMTGQPMVYTLLAAGGQNIMAERTAVRINAVTSEGFTASLSSDGIDEQGVASAMNGDVTVKDCTK
jgi:hypothetical protein